MAYKLSNYNGSIVLSDGITQRGNYPLMEAHDILVGEDDLRLDDKLESLSNLDGEVGTLGDKVTALEEALKNFDGTGGGTGGGTGVSGEDIAEAISAHNVAEDAHQNKFDTYLKQIGSDKALDFFVGSREEYEELEDKTNLFAIITDDEVNNNIVSNLAPLIEWKNSVMSGGTVVPRAESDFSGIPFTQKYLQKSQLKYLHQIRLRYTAGGKIVVDCFFNLVVNYNTQLNTFEWVRDQIEAVAGIESPISATGYICDGNNPPYYIHSVAARIIGSDAIGFFGLLNGELREYNVYANSTLPLTITDKFIPLADI